MRSRTIVLAALGVLVAPFLYAHDLFIKLESYFLAPASTVRIPVLNGTFAASENGVARARLADLSLVTPAGRQRLDTALWDTASSVSYLAVTLGDPGTYIVGVSTRPSRIDLSAQDFNAYLEHDGLPDILEARRRNNELDRPARERYHKHVKAVFQVGDRRSGGFQIVLGYPAEIVPLDNPYTARVGDTIRFRCLVDGQPVPNQYVLAGGEGTGGPIQERAARTDANGIVSFSFEAPGRWYVKFIHMARLANADVDYESKWATLTFALR